MTGENPKARIGALKAPLQYIPMTALIHEAHAFDDGQMKYGPFNWRHTGVSLSTYYAAAMRHLMQYWDGEDYDPISGVHHLAHARACCAILLDTFELGSLVDDRPPPGPLPELIRRTEKKGETDAMNERSD